MPIPVLFARHGRSGQNVRYLPLRSCAGIISGFAYEDFTYTSNRQFHLAEYAPYNFEKVHDGTIVSPNLQR